MKTVTLDATLSEKDIRKLAKYIREQCKNERRATLNEAERVCADKWDEIDVPSSVGAAMLDAIRALRDNG
jgi:hypothetical protein